MRDRISPYLTRSVPIYRSETILRKLYNLKNKESWSDYSGKQVILVCGIANPEKILKLLNKNESQIDFVKDRLGHDWRYAINNSKIQNELNWFPQVDFESGLKELI